MKKFDKSVSMLCWGLNEEKSLPAFFDRAIALMDEAVSDFEIVFVDDGSTDKTPLIAASYAKKDSRIRVITHPININVGWSCRTALANARKDYIFWQTIDWSYDLKNLRIFLELLNYFDVVQGIRPVPIRLLSSIPILRSIYRVGARSDNLFKAFVSLTNYYLLRILFNVHFHDFQNVTFYPRSMVHMMSLHGKTSFINPELLIRAYSTGAKFIEVPIPFIPRTEGIAKGTKPMTILRSVIDIFKNWISWGLSLRCSGALNSNPNQILRIANPFKLDDEVIILCAPLFKVFSDSNQNYR